MRVVEAAEAEVELRREERRTHICVPVRLVRKMRCRFGCSVGPCFLVSKILYAMQNGFGSPDACFVGDSLRRAKLQQQLLRWSEVWKGIIACDVGCRN